MEEESRPFTTLASRSDMTKDGEVVYNGREKCSLQKVSIIHKYINKVGKPT